MAEMDEQVAPTWPPCDHPTVALLVRDRDGAPSSPSTTGAAPSWRSTSAVAPTSPCTRFGREHNARIAAAPARLRRRDRPGRRPPHRQVIVLAVEVGDRVFQLAYEHDPDGDRAVVEEGITMMTAYLERYARVSAREQVAAACPPGRRRGPAGRHRRQRLSLRERRPGRDHRVRRRARDLHRRRRARRPRRHRCWTAGWHRPPSSRCTSASTPTAGATAVVHTHAPWSTAVACVLDELPVLHYQQLPARRGGPRGAVRDLRHAPSSPRTCAPPWSAARPR